MIFLGYMLSELRRRSGRTLLTALGLGVGVGMVIAVNALSSGLDKAQSSVLRPLTGVGTDMVINRPIAMSGDFRAAFERLSPSERNQLRRELGGGELDFGTLRPGQRFSRTTFRSTQLSFPAAKVGEIAGLPGAAAAAGGLTLSVSTISGIVPDQAQTGAFGGGPPAEGAEGPEAGHGGGNAGEGGEAGHGSAGFNATTIAGVDTAEAGLGPIVPSALTTGSWFTPGPAREAILDVAFARTRNKAVGDTITIGKARYDIVGLARTPLGGASSNLYVKLDQLQALSGRRGRVNTVYARANAADGVDAVAAAAKRSLPGASVTTARTLAASVTGSLSSARKLTDKLGIVLEIVVLLGAVLIAALLSLSSVTKRIRELGTLKALGWPRRLVVRQIAGESLLQGLLGGALGIVIGLAAAGAITLAGPTLQASLPVAASPSGPFGDEEAASAAGATVSQAVELTARLSPAVIALAVALAVLGGLLSGAAGALRASRLRPVEALRHVD